MKKRNAGMIMISERTAIVEPISVSFSALCPCPFSKNSCPGRTPRAVSSFGAPRKIEGIKSMKVWVIAMAVMKTEEYSDGKREESN